MAYTVSGLYSYGCEGRMAKAVTAIPQQIPEGREPRKKKHRGRTTDAKPGNLMIDMSIDFVTDAYKSATGPIGDDGAWVCRCKLQRPSVAPVCRQHNLKQLSCTRERPCMRASLHARVLASLHACIPVRERTCVCVRACVRACMIS